MVINILMKQIDACQYNMKNLSTLIQADVPFYLTVSTTVRI